MPNAHHDLYYNDLLETPSPNFTHRQVRDIIEKLYGVTGELSLLDSERDQNFNLETSTGEQFVVKIANSIEDQGIIDMQLKALKHIALVDPKLPVPQVMISRNGLALEQIQVQESSP